MPKQKLEGMFRRSCVTITIPYYVMKLQTMPLSHLKPPADYLLLTNAKNYLVEAKQVQMKGNTASFAFDRLSQENDMSFWNKSLDRNESYLLLMFYTGMIATSDIYMIPLYKYLDCKRHSKKKSVNNHECAVLFKDYKVSVLKGSILDLNSFFTNAAQNGVETTSRN